MSHLDMWESTAFPEGAPHLIDRLDDAIHDAEGALNNWCRASSDVMTDGNTMRDALRDLITAAQQARDTLDAEGFGR